MAKRRKKTTTRRRRVGATSAAKSTDLFIGAVLGGLAGIGVQAAVKKLDKQGKIKPALVGAIQVGVGYYLTKQRNAYLKGAGYGVAGAGGAGIATATGVIKIGAAAQNFIEMRSGTPRILGYEDVRNVSGTPVRKAAGSYAGMRNIAGANGAF